MSNFVSQAKVRSEPSAMTWLSDFQAAAEERWGKVLFPQRKTEHWKYTNLSLIERQDFFSATPDLATPSQSLLDDMAIEGLESFDLVFVNGIFSAALSSDLTRLPDGLSLFRFADASPEQQAIAKKMLGSVANQPLHLFVTLNDFQLNDGVFIRIMPDVSLSTPVRILNLTSGQTQPAHSAQRVFIQLDKGAKATVVEQFGGDHDSGKLLVNNVTEVLVEDNATLQHYRLSLEHESAIHLGAVHTNLHCGATLQSFYLALGAQLKRTDVVVNHVGEGAHCEINGVYLPHNKQHVDFHTCIEHAVPRCTSDEVFRGIIGDEAKAVFNGRIHIHKHAQKTLAHLSNKNLLTSDKAEVNTKPELEIYADDVQCAHGATVAQLDLGSLHYLKTRGISEDEARVMLNFGFINELISELRSAAVARYLRPQLSRLFSRDPELLRHLL